jgi:hypothetical protein
MTVHSVYPRRRGMPEFDANSSSRFGLTSASRATCDVPGLISSMSSSNGQSSITLRFSVTHGEKSKRSRMECLDEFWTLAKGPHA